MLDPGEHWLLEPRLVDPSTHLWSPGIKTGVRRGSWFHRTECFGPVLGLIEAADLDEALAVQGEVAFGLTGGIHTLDPANVEQWLDRVEVGNAYVNRAITGAIVQRQPFGGWKRSVVGPAAKAGGPNYAAQLGHWTDGVNGFVGHPSHGHDSSWAEPTAPLSPEELAWLDAARASDERWQRDEFGRGHDPSALFCESNELRYRPIPLLVMRVEADARPAHVLRALAAVEAAGGHVALSVAPEASGLSFARDAVRETASELVGRLDEHPVDRVRVIGTASDALAELSAFCFVDARPVVAEGRIEGLRYRREQSVSRTLHRFGNLTEGGRGARASPED
jgi:RHH-type proline utilization regulon transcriptional repressor/proline dehydrogenase/delta 1-pyrroline-5-carboxylate dehydrogenase